MVRKAIEDDLIEGGRDFVRVLKEIDANPARAEELLALRNQLPPSSRKKSPT